MPALAVEITLSALILGMVFTTLPFGDYVTSPLFRSYFLNVVGDIHYLLPGVFAHNIAGPGVNLQLWTVPYELECYATIALLAFLGIARRRWLLLAALVVLQVAYGVHGLAKHPDFYRVSGHVLVGSFLAGILIFKFREKIPASPALFALSLALTMALLVTPSGDYFVMLPAAYATVYAGILNPPRAKLLLNGDYSYGLYLYGYPLQQAAVAASAWLGAWVLHPWANFALSYSAACALAAFSWWRIEKPAGALRQKLYALERLLLRIPLATWHSRRVLGAPEAA